jgi:hypothetical protein
VASKRASAEGNPEGFVKNYQLEITNGKLDTVISSVQALQKQVSDFSTLVQTRPTNEQVDDKIKAAVAGMTKDLDTAVREIKLQFGPAVRTSGKLLWGILASGLSILAGLIMVIIGFYAQ